MTGPTQRAQSGTHKRAAKQSDRHHAKRSRASRPQPADVASSAQAENRQQATSWFSRHMDDAPGWVLSLVFHAALLIILALITVSFQFRDNLPEILAVFGEQEQAPAQQKLDTKTESIEISVEEESLLNLDEQQIQSEFDLKLPVVPEEKVSSLEDFASTELLEALPTLGSQELSGRSAAGKAELIAREGGTPQSEAAVALGLQWLAKHQNREGSWSYNHQGGSCRRRCSHPGSMAHCTTGATGMALLCFLGSGHSEHKGEYREVVRRGVKYLVAYLKKMKRDPGNLRGRGRNEGMYAQGIATLALCEAYNLGRNPDLREPAQEALNYIIRAQDPRGGGWRYEPRDAGDTSVVGWQVMALYSGKIAEFQVPEETLEGAWYFLDSVQSDGGVAYGYTSRSRRVSPTLSAVGLLSRMYLGQARGWDIDNPIAQAAADRLVSIGPSRNDMYYNYYATQYMYQIGGVKWRHWNDVMRDALVAAQEQQGHAAGSWLPTCPHGAAPGGRLYMTAMCILTLEVYYRHLPIYERSRPDPDGEEDDAELK